MKKLQGFTLIELLIVIALLGALAVGLLAALDPFEQLKKGTDTGVRNTVSELQGSIIRYYSIKNQMPWCADGACGTFEDGLADTVVAKTANLMPNTIGNIVTAGELKKDFMTLAGTATLTKIVVFGSNTNATVTVCYLPKSKSFTNDPNTKFNPADGTDVGCTNTGDPATNTCLWCVK
jgi:prepilin-type N-terminal cleavage/methylation domain-containing protein